MSENGTKTTRTLGAWVRLITAIATAVATVAATGTALYTALDNTKESKKAVEKAEVADNKADATYEALASKLDALMIEVAYLRGKVDGQSVVIKRAPARLESEPIKPDVQVEEDELVGTTKSDAPTKPAAKVREERPPAFKKGARFRIEAYQGLPRSLDDLARVQEQYQDDN